MNLIIYWLSKKNTYPYGKARFLPFFKRLFFLNRYNKGLCINGTEFIKEKKSYEHLMLIAPTGSGKTIRYLFPDILLKPTRGRSIVITDPSGEIYQKSHAYLKSKGFTIKVFDIYKCKNFYNPLAYVESYTQLSELVEIIIDTNLSQGNSSDLFWAESAKSITSLLVKALLKKYEKKATLPMVLDHLNLMSIKKNTTVHELMATFLEEKDLNSYKAFISQEDKLKSSVLSTAKSCFHKFNDPILAYMTSKDTLDFKTIRKNKTILFLVIPELQQEYYKLIATIFYNQLFDISMSTNVKEKGILPMYFFLEEAGNLGKIPSLKTVITAGRKRKISVSVILQDLRQLESIYGIDHKTIFNNCVHKMVYGGLSIEEAELFSKMVGNTTILKTDEVWSLKHLFSHRKKTEFGKALISANELRSLSKDKALFLSGNKQPIVTYTKPYHENRKLLRKLRQAEITTQKETELLEENTEDII